jgi:hypothetical protein
MVRNAATDRRRHSAVVGPTGSGEAAALGPMWPMRLPGAGSAEQVESREEMPEVTRFFGIVVRMYFRDHSPAHFHAEYGEYEALVEIETLAILRGELPRRAMALVLEWAALHRQELRADWERARGGTPFGIHRPTGLRRRHEIGSHPGR